jgi:hypothetical protein
MAINSIQLLYNDFRGTTEYSPDYTLDFFSRNAIEFNDINTFQDSDVLHLYIELTWQYINALFVKDRYNNTIDQSTKHLEIIDKEIECLCVNSIKDEWYYGILFLKGMAAYRLRDYKTSTFIFKGLTQVDSKNENYKNWLHFSKYGQRMWISAIIAIICCILLLIEIFFGKYIPSFMARISLDGIALTGFIGTILYDYYIKRSFKKTRKNM